MDSGEVGRNYEAIRLVGDARLTLEALADVMKTIDGGKRRTARAALEARIAAGRAAHDAEMASFLSNAGEPLHPAQVMAALQAVLTPESIVVADASFSSIWATNNLVSLRSRDAVHHAARHGRLGWGLPMALGAAVAEPEAPIYCITGDGGFAHVWSEMEVAARSNLKVTLIVLNNGILGYVKCSEKLRYGKNSTSVDIFPIDHVALAGLAGFRASASNMPKNCCPPLNRPACRKRRPSLR